MTIPKIIHQTFSDTQLPAILRGNIARLKALNPTWEYRFYDDDDMSRFIVANYDSRILDCFNRLNPEYGAARADLFRYLLMYKFGGVYLDIKSSLHISLDTVLRADDHYLLSYWQNGRGEAFEGWTLNFPELRHIARGEFMQWHIVAAPEHPFLKAVIDAVLKNIECYQHGVHGVGKMGVVRVTGPIAYTLAIEPLLKHHPHRFVDSYADLGFEYNIFRRSGNPKSHHALFKKHYSELTAPIVKTQPSN